MTGAESLQDSGLARAEQSHAWERPASAKIADTDQPAERERQLASLLAILDGIFYRCELSPPWRMSFASSGVEALTGFPPEVLGDALPWAELMHPEDVERVSSEIGRAIGESRAFSVEYRIIRASGEERWVAEQGHAVLSPDGEPGFLEGVITDTTERKQLEISLGAAIRRHEECALHWQRILDKIPQKVWSMPAGSMRPDYYNDRWYEFTGLPRGVLPDSVWASVYHPDDVERMRATWLRSCETGEPFHCEYRLRRYDGEYRWVLARGRPERGPDGRITRWYGTCSESHETVLARAALSESEALSRSIISASPDSIKLLDLDGTVLFVNDGGCSALELPCPSALVGQSWTSTLPSEARAQAEQTLATARSGRLGRLTIFQPTMAGRPKWWDVMASPVMAEDGHPARLLVISRDITQQKRIEEQAAWSANHDSLTRLANRTLFQAGVETAIEQAKASDGKFALLLLDVDHFKRVNDTLGHDAGDKLLCTFAERLTAAARADDLVARLGGDEFAVLLSGVGSAEEVTVAVDHLLDRLREPCLYGGRMLDCEASIGASIFPLDGSDRASLLKNADIALYAAKGAGRGNLKLFQPRMRREMQLRSSMLNIARDALSMGRILPYYQPKVAMRTGQVSGFEALLRWRHPSRGVQLPSSIAAAFEDMNLAAQISDLMVERVVRDMSHWLDRGIDFGHAAINASAAEFRRGDFAERVLERLERARIPARYLQLEVTETVFLGRGAEYVERALKTLSRGGIKIALDDFGTGYASLSHLKQFPVDLIKIDRSFVRDFERFPDDAAIIKAVIGLGHSLGIEVIAEGIELEAQHRFLLEAGCTQGQGFLFGKAVPAERVPEVVRARREDELAA